MEVSKSIKVKDSKQQSSGEYLYDFISNLNKRLKEEFPDRNVMDLPKIMFVSVNAGIGKEFIKDKSYLEFAESVISKITGQKPDRRLARKSISNFKLREGMIVGLVSTIRGKRMIDFIIRLNSIAIPRTRDFRGLSDKSFDKHGNYSIGIRDFRIFPETADIDVTRSMGLQVNVVIRSKSVEDSKKLLKIWGFPIKDSD